MAATMGGSLFAALAFSGAGYLFHLLDKNGYSDEVKRHNKAMEDLTRAREKWYEEEVRRKDEINRRRQELIETHQDMKAVKKALSGLRDISISFKNREFSRKPELKDFYRPSSEFKHYEKFVVGTAGAVGGAVSGHCVITNLIFYSVFLVSFSGNASFSIWMT